MTTLRDIRLSPIQRAVKLATADAVAAAGGQAFVASELNCAQSRVSDYCSVNTADFIAADKALRLDVLAGSPVIVPALCRLSGGTFVAAGTEACVPQPLEIHLPEIAGEMADVVRKLAERVARRKAMSPLAQDDLLREVCQAMDALSNLHSDLLASGATDQSATVTNIHRDTS